MTVDDSQLIHARSTYDPAKAREYYLRTRKLKGRKTGQAEGPGGGGSPAADKVPTRGNRGTPPDGKAKRQALLAEKERLEARLDRLREVLREAVEAAKKRSGVDTKEKKESKEKETKEKPKTAAEKREAAKEAKERRDEEAKKTPLSKDLEVLRGQIADIRKQIQDALEDARRKTKSKAKSTNETTDKTVDSKQEGERQNGRRDR